ncbi:MAG: heat-inducible transcriptional repressor HrcA [bacterium]
MNFEDLNERQQKILRAIIKDYQSSAEPVGSRSLSKKYLPEFSPATIRNDMADLEEEGFITHPHTSAGRIPTDKGYRFYVDRLMKAMKPTQREEDAIKSGLHVAHNLDEILHQTAKLLSHALDYTAIVVKMGPNNRVHHSGTANLLHQPEFQNLEQMQRILELLEEEDELAKIVHENATPHEVNIKIGSENKNRQIKECSIIVSSYEIDDEPIGGIGIIGPTRMFYNKATSLIDYVSRELSNILRNGDFI